MNSWAIKKVSNKSDFSLPYLKKIHILLTTSELLAWGYQRGVICDLVQEIKTRKVAWIAFHTGAVWGGAFLDNIIRNILIKILVVGKLIDQEVFDTCPLLFEVDVIRTKMILYRMSFTARLFTIYWGANVLWGTLHISFNPCHNPVSSYYFIFYLRKLSLGRVKWSA